ncbi:MAG TPA: TonB family protein [Longimicrobium sp.]|nr:TonB family protein [Longimicrobium sp.]
MSSTGTLSAGTLVADRYQVEEPLAGEGSSAVYRATDTRLERAVALRALHASDAGTLARQGKAAARLIHPHVARVLDFGADAALGVEFVVADLGTGGTLAALLAQRGTPPLQLALRMVQEAAAGMAAAHRAGLVHGDLHPGLLWLSRDEGRLRVQVLGLGLNPAGGPPPRATARYASPERLRRARDLSPAADVFSLGVVAYEVFAGLPAEWTTLLLSMARGQAVVAPSLLEARPELPAHVAQAVRRALLADPAQRWPDAGELAAHLIAESAAAPQPASAPVPAPIPIPSPAAVTAESFAASIAEAAAPADEPAAAAEAEPVAAVASPAEPGPEVVGAAQPVAGAPVAAPGSEREVVETAPAVAEAPAPEPEPVAASTPVAPPAPVRQPPARRAKPIAAAGTDLADSLYIPPALEKPARRGTPATPPSPAVSAEPAVPVAAAPPPPPKPEVVPQPVQPRVEPVIETPAPVQAREDAEETVAAPIVAAALTTTTAAPVEPATESTALVVAEAVAADVIPIERRRGGGLAKLGQPSGGNRRGLLAASIAVAVIVSGGVIARTVLAGSSADTPAAQGLASRSLASAGAARGTEAQLPAANAGAPVAADSPLAADENLTPEEQRRREEEREKLEEQRRLQQRQRDSLRAAQQLAAQQQPQPAAPQVALAAAPRPAASGSAPQIETRPQAPAAPAESTAPPPAPARPRADPNRVYGGGEVDQAPSLANGSAFRSAVQRTYPPTLRNSGQWGNAIVSFTVGTDGRVERGSISVDQVSHPAFRAAATAAISSARFNPARVDGQPVRAQVSMPITWQGGGERED